MTPRKIGKNICTVCKIVDLPNGSTWRHLNSDAGLKKNLSTLLLKYGEIDVLEGVVCRNCERKLLSIDKQVSEFRSKCNEKLDLVGGKRCMSEHLSKATKRRSESIEVRAKTELFPNTPDSGTCSISTEDKENDSYVLNVIPTTPRLSFSNSSDSGYVTLLTPILPKPSFQSYSTTPGTIADINKSTAQSKCITSTPKPENRGSELKLSKKHDDELPLQEHNYASSASEKFNRKKACSRKKKKPSESSLKTTENNDLHKKLFEQPEICDILSSEEFSTVISVLPTRSRKTLVNTILQFAEIKTLVKEELLSELSKEHKILKNRKHGKISTLMTKDFKDLKQFTWDSIVNEAVTEFPLLVDVLLAFLVPDSLEQKTKVERVASLTPRIGFLYSVLAQGRNHELSKVQRVISINLFDNLCDQKVFDRLQPIGVCLSYGHGLTILDKFSGNFNSAVIDALKDEKRIRLVGDNINWKTNVHDERQDNHGKMHHAFGSAVIVQTLSFENISRIKPQKLFYEVDHQLFLPSSDEWKHIKEEYAIHMLHVAFKHIPYFKIFEKLITKQIVGQYSEQLKKKNKVVPLPVLHLNEQKYDDVVQIMDYYENFLSDTYEKAGLDFNNNTHVHCGGDQLTRERYSGAKRLRSGAATPSNRFEHLSPITFELFHMQMNYVKLIFKRLYSEEGLQEQGTLKCEANRVLRTNLNPNVNDHFDADKDFIVSFTDAYIVEAITHFFDMESLFSAPRKNALPDNVCTENQKKEWVMDMFQQIVEIYVWDKENKQNQEDNVEVDGVVIPIQLSNGKRRSYVIKKAQKSQAPQEDKVKNYGHLCLELGLQFKAILDLCKLPDRERGLRLLKVCMIHFKANNNLSKYAYEILRLLVHQLCILSEQEAHEEFYGLFVNTKGKIDSHIPCDLQMEYIVKSVKRNIKHMFSNKTDKNITTRTSALPAIKDIADNFDKTSGVIIRCKKHSSIDAIKDELDIIFDLQNVNPFTFTAGRSHDSFKTISSRMDKLLDVHHFHSWIESNVYKHATELGN